MDKLTEGSQKGCRDRNEIPPPRPGPPFGMDGSERVTIYPTEIEARKAWLRAECLRYDKKHGVYPESELEGLSMYQFIANNDEGITEDMMRDWYGVCQGNEWE